MSAEIALAAFDKDTNKGEGQGLLENVVYLYDNKVVLVKNIVEVLKHRTVICLPDCPRRGRWLFSTRIYGRGGSVILPYEHPRRTQGCCNCASQRAPLRCCNEIEWSQLVEVVLKKQTSSRLRRAKTSRPVQLFFLYGCVACIPAQY